MTHYTHEVNTPEFHQFRWGLEESFSRLSPVEQRSAAYLFLDLIENILRDIELTDIAKRWTISQRLDWLAGQAERVQCGGHVYRGDR